MPRRRITWIVIADGSRARIVTPRAERPGYDVVSELDSQEARMPSREIVSDKPGRGQESANPGRHSMEPRQNPHDVAKVAFVRDLAERVNQAATENRFDHLILFAPPRALGELREILGESARRKLKAEAAKDLTNLPIGELGQHIEALNNR